MILCSEIELSLQKTKYYDKIPSFSEDQTKMKIGMYHKQENRRLMGHFYDMKNRFWAVGCGLGWAVGKKVWADYEQLLREVFSTFCGQKKRLKTL